MFSYTVDRRGDAVCLAVAGDVDLEVHRTLRDAVAEALALHPATLTVDVGALQLIDSTGIGILLQARRAAAATGAQLTLTNVRGFIRGMLHTLGILDYLTGPAVVVDPNA